MALDKSNPDQVKKLSANQLDNQSTAEGNNEDKNLPQRFANWFIDHGFAIFPIDPESKKPVIKEWQRYSTTPLSDEEKKQYLEMIKNGYNYAVPGGQRNLVILDFEDKELLKAWIGELALNELCNRTLCVSTPHGGIHIYVTADEIPDHKFNPVFTQNGKGIADLQSYNSYVLAPGSCINHKFCESDKCVFKGQDYTTCYIPINNNMNIAKVDLKGLLRFLTEKGKKLGIELSPSARGWLLGEKEEGKEVIEDEFIGELKKRNKFRSVEDAKNEICKQLNRESIQYKVICEGKTYSEVGIDRSRGDFRVIKTLLYHGLRDPELILKVLPNDSKAKDNEKWNPRKYFLLTLKNAWSVVLKYLDAKKVSKEDKSQARGLLIEAIAEEIMREHRLVTFKQSDQVKEWIIGLFRFNRYKGVFEPYDVTIEKDINEKLEEYDKDFPLGSDKSRVIRNIKEEIMRRTLKPLVKEPMRVAFKNGTVEWSDNGIIWYDVKERSPKVYAFHYIPWSVKIEEIEKFQGKEITVQAIEDLARRVCPKSLETFKQWVDDKWILLFEVIGYTLYPRYVFNKAVLLTGSGSNGKSTFLNLLLRILGKNNVSAVSLKRIVEGDKFASIELYHKLANISSELFQFRVTNTDLFKKLTGEDYVEGQKKFKDPIYFVNYAKLINATNELPVVKDQTYGFWRRWIVIEFPHLFEEDPGYFERTFTNEEIEGIITVSILAFARVMQKKKFDFEDSSADIKEKWERASDSVYAFVKELIESGRAEYDPKNGDLFTPVKELYQAYTEWCEENDRKPEAQQTVTKRLETKFRITKDRKKVNGERVWCYVGIRLKDKNENNTVGDGDNNDTPDNLLELYKQYSGTVRSRKDLQDELGLRAYELLDWCEKKNLCHWVDEEHVRFD